MIGPHPHSIKQKLMLAIMGTSLVVLVLTCTVFVTFEIVTVRRGMVSGLMTRAGLIAASSGTALESQNAADATEVLAALGKDPHMLSACLYDKNGHLFATFPARAAASRFPMSPPKVGAHFGWSGLTITGPVMKGNLWCGTVYVKSDLAILTERVKLYAVLSLIVIVGALCLSYALSAWLQKRIAEPILQLTQTARGVSERKDYSLRTPKLTDDEIGLLTDTFNGMLAEIQRTESSLRENEASLRAILESALDCIITMDQEGRIFEFNPAAQRVFGYTREEVIGKLLGDLIVPPKHDEQHLLGWREYLATGANAVLGQRIELLAHRVEGDEFPVEVAVTRIALDGPPMFTGFIRDITHRKVAERKILQLNAELEQRVAERTTQLQISNRELEAFSYSVSHDLRAPLRGIDGFTLVILEDYGERLDDEGRRLLERVRNAAQRMALLIDDMLNLARISRAEMRREPVDLSALAQRIATDLKQLQPERSIDFVIEPKLTASGDEQLLRILLENLLGNAWKYTSKHPAAKIEFGITTQNSERAYFVRDDGAGFDMEHVGRLFAPFQRLHRQTDFEGTGIGLATVQRIIARHGGRIWTEAAVEQGATFYFTL